MNKKLLSLALLTLSFGISYAQDNQQMLDYFKQEQERKEAKYKELQAKSPNVYPLEDISRLAEIGDDYAWFYQDEDIRANKAANVDNLQNGEVGGFVLDGTNMEIGVFDGGKVRATNREFRNPDNHSENRIIDLENGAQAISSHATNVSGFIAAEGIGSRIGVSNITKGVLPKAIIKHAGYSTTSNGTVYQKIANAGVEISNHSYGVNSGWSYKTPANDNVAVTGWYYGANVSNMANPEQTFFGAYQSNDYNYDYLVNNNPNLILVKSSGNYFGTTPAASPNLPKFKFTNSGYVAFTETDIVPNANCWNNAYCIGTGSLAKNVIVVGAINLPSAVNDFKITSSSDIVRSSYSSVGPRKDGAIKPDLVTVGTSVYAPGASSDTAIDSGSGTSFSAPKVTGVVGALTQLKRELTNNDGFNFTSDQMRAILLHTTIEAGDFEGPDNWFGWGALDGLKAAQVILATHNEEEYFERPVKVSGENYTKVVSARENEPLKVTITWIDPSATASTTTNQVLNDTSSKLINDLDLRIIDTESNEVYFPWKLDLANVAGAAVKGDNTVDNIEQITINAPIAGRNYRVEVSNKGTLVNQARQASNTNFTILITGANEENLATNDLTKKSKVSVYPTVAKDVVNVESTAKIQKVELFDFTGKLISTTKANTVNVSSLPSGVYIVNITTAEGVTSKKIVKQ